jgi:hypothetical protein
VDAPTAHFECSDAKKKTFEMDLSGGKDLLCASPFDTETFIKACKQGNVIDIALCHFTGDDLFDCKDGDKDYQKHLAEVNNYFCLTEQHRKRVIDRCKNH